MNTNFLDAKEHFIKQGYCNASLKDIDIDFYNYLEANFLCDEEKNLQHKKVYLKFTFLKVRTVDWASWFIRQFGQTYTQRSNTQRDTSKWVPWLIGISNKLTSLKCIEP